MKNVISRKAADERSWSAFPRNRKRTPAGALRQLRGGVRSRLHDALRIPDLLAVPHLRIGSGMPHPHYSLQEWLVDWEWWTMHVFPTFLETLSQSLSEKVEAYFKIRYPHDPAWRHGRMLDAWRFVLGDLQNLLADKVAWIDSSGTLTLHSDLPTTLWLYFNDGRNRAAVDRAVLTPEILEEFGRLIRANLKTDSSSG